MRFIIRVGLVLSLLAGVAEAEVVVIVASGSPVTDLSKHQIENIFLGRARQFPDGRRAVPVDQSEGAATRDEFYRRFTGKSPAQVKAYWSKLIFTGRGQPPPEVANGIQVKKFVLENPGAIGYIDDKLANDKIRILRTR